MKPCLNIYDLCRDFINDNSTWLGALRTKWLLGQCRARNFKSLASISTDPRARITCARDMKFYLQVEAFFKKNSLLTDKAMARAAAEDTFQRAERLCRITNRRLDHYYLHADRLDPRLSVLVARTEEQLGRVLGDFNTFLEGLPSMVRVTSGATATSPRMLSAPPLKIKRRPSMYPGTVPYYDALTRFYGINLMASHKTRVWNRVEFVAKSWKTDRTIACEQEGSLPFQLAFDTYAKKRLRRFGIDLRDQTSNQSDAKLGSLDGSLATIDMSMASDTVAFNTVAWLFPQPFFDYLNANRASHYRLAGRLASYAKFSSMGNGATFAIETLVFFAMCKAVGSTRCHVYGDDITIETELVDDLQRLLRFFGFIPNVEKSHVRGPYRESCGHHYYSGELITPFYIRSMDPWDDPNWAHLVNGLAPLSEHGNLWRRLKSFVFDRKLLLTFGSENTTSGVHLHPYFGYRQAQCRPDPEIFGLRVKAYQLKVTDKTATDLQGLFLWYLRNPPTLKEARSERIGASRALDSKSYTTTDLERKFRRRWVSWEFPKSGLPDYLYDFSDYLFA